MTLDFLSGLLLTTATIAIVLFVIKEVVGDRRSGTKKSRQPLAPALTRMSGSKAKPVNAHLIGSVGKVISHSGDSARPMRVRLGPELWPARLDSTEAAALPVGTAAEVVAVDGAVLVVVAGSDSAGPPDGSEQTNEAETSS